MYALHWRSQLPPQMSHAPAALLNLLFMSAINSAGPAAAAGAGGGGGGGGSAVVVVLVVVVLLLLLVVLLLLLVRVLLLLCCPPLIEARCTPARNPLWAAIVTSRMGFPC
jgi:hypothetical protein